MKKIIISGILFLGFCLALVMLTPALWAAEEYRVTLAELFKHKAVFDDPRPYYKEGPLAYKNVLPPDEYAKLTYDVEKMKKAWAEAVGFGPPMW